MSGRNLRKGIAGSVLTAGLLAGLSGGAAFASSGTSGSSGSSFNNAKVALETELANRVTALGHLAADVSGSTTLTTDHKNLLSARIATEQTNINALVVKVPGDTTRAELNADRNAMYRDNRVYAVMTPQVFETISADAAIAQFTSLAANEPTLASEVASIVGQPQYHNALNHDNNYVARVGRWSTQLSNLEVTILAQQPSNYPGDQHFFANANKQILNANVAIAYADYDASIIALETGGYTGS